jgi:hypothetical protein
MPPLIVAVLLGAGGICCPVPQKKECRRQRAETVTRWSRRKISAVSNWTPQQVSTAPFRPSAEVNRERHYGGLTCPEKSSNGE